MLGYVTRLSHLQSTKSEPSKPVSEVLYTGSDITEAFKFAPPNEATQINVIFRDGELVLQEFMYDYKGYLSVVQDLRRKSNLEDVKQITSVLEEMKSKLNKEQANKIIKWDTKYNGQVVFEANERLLFMLSYDVTLLKKGKYSGHKETLYRGYTIEEAFKFLPESENELVKVNLLLHDQLLQSYVIESDGELILTIDLPLTHDKHESALVKAMVEDVKSRLDKTQTHPDIKWGTFFEKQPDIDTEFSNSLKVILVTEDDYWKLPKGLNILHEEAYSSINEYRLSSSIKDIKASIQGLNISAEEKHLLDEDVYNIALKFRNKKVFSSHEEHLSDLLLLELNEKLENSIPD